MRKKGGKQKKMCLLYYHDLHGILILNHLTDFIDY